MPVCYIALGGNLGDVRRTFDRALNLLEHHAQISVLRTSSVHSTTPIGQNAGAVFLNSSAEIETELAPMSLLRELQSVENQCGRTRDRHWGPRTLDLDLIFHADQIVDEPELTVPHLAAWYRRFVLDPLSEICPSFVHPERELTVTDLRERLLVRPLRFSLLGGHADIRQELAERLRNNFADVEFECHETIVSDELDATIAFWLGNMKSETSNAFDALPRHNRLNVSNFQAADQFAVLQSVIQSALG